jgi:hypothetical protein
LRSNNVTTLNKVVEKNDKKSELKVGESVWQVYMKSVQNTLSCKI